MDKNSIKMGIPRAGQPFYLPAAKKWKTIETEKIMELKIRCKILCSAKQSEFLQCFWSLEL